MLDVRDNLHDMQKAFGAAAAVATIAQQEKKNLAVVKLRFQLTKQPVNACLARLHNSFKRKDILASAIGVKTTFSLSALESDVQNKLSKALNSTVNMPPSDGKADALSQTINELFFTLSDEVM
jgi:hypothetical protein